MANLNRHIKNMQLYGLPIVVAINHFVSDTDKEIQMIKDDCAKQNVEAILTDAWAKGGMMETNFLLWTNSGDQILSDLSNRYLYRHPLESVKINEDTKSLLPKLKNLIKQAGFNPNYYTATNSAFDEPYDAYKPTGKNAHSPIEIMQIGRAHV